MKKGISLIVLVITIIVMIIIAGAIILSLSSSNVTTKANWATLSSDRANYQAEYATKYAAAVNDDGTVGAVTMDANFTSPWSIVYKDTSNAEQTYTSGTAGAPVDGTVIYTIDAETAATKYGLTVDGTTVKSGSKVITWVRIGTAG